MIASAVKMLFGAAFLAWLAVDAAAQVPGAAQSEPQSWPTDAWTFAEMPVDAASVVRDQVDIAFAKARSDEMGETRSVVVVHGGEIVFEQYADGFDSDTKQLSWSLAKSVNQALLGVAVQNGIVPDIDAPMPSAFPDDDPRSAITWRQWIEMTDGMAWKEVDEPSFTRNDAVQLFLGAGRFDAVSYITGRQTLRRPGSHWNYNTGGTILVADALARQLSPDRDPTTIKSRYDALLFDRLGVDLVVEFDPQGAPLAGGSMWASAHDWAKFGLLYLRDGVWDGDRLLPEGWVEWARNGSETDDGNVYGAGFWRMVPANQATHAGRSPEDGPWDAFAMQGSEGQIVWIVPSRDLVIVRTGIMENTRPNWTALMNWCQAIARAFPDVGA